MIVIQNENRIFINICLFEFYDKFGFFGDIVSAHSPNLLNIILWYMRRTFLCVNIWPIIKFEIGLMADFGYGNQEPYSQDFIFFVTYKLVQ